MPPPQAVMESKMSNANKAADDGEHRIAADLYKEVLKASENIKDATLFSAWAREYLAVELVCLKQYDEADQALSIVFGAAKELWATSAAMGEGAPNLRRRKEIGMLLKENLRMSFNRAAYFEGSGNYEKAISVFEENLGRLKQLKYTTTGVKQLEWYDKEFSKNSDRIKHCKKESTIQKLQKQVEHYFSSKNLATDTFLKQHMDDDGMVFLYLIASFKQISKLKADMNTLREACKRSTSIEYKRVVVDVDKVGRKQSKGLYLLPSKDRLSVLPNDVVLEFARACQAGRSAPSDFQKFESQFLVSPAHPTMPVPSVPAIEVDSAPSQNGKASTSLPDRPKSANDDSQKNGAKDNAGLKPAPRVSQRGRSLSSAGIGARGKAEPKKILRHPRPRLFDSPTLEARSDDLNTRKWFRELERSQSMLENFRDDFIDHSNKTQPRNKRRVRIAILDTGIDTNIEEIRNNDRFVKRYCPIKGFASGKDKDGHGTHLATLVHKLAPSADIYTARVIIDGEKVDDITQKAPEDSQDPNSLSESVSIIAETIKKAAEEWEVDIITMSFGFPHFQAEIYDAVREATKRCLIFAAASNDGANPKEQIAYPARQSQVFSVWSTDGNGNPSGFNPDFDDDGFSLSTLGENVVSTSSEGRLLPMSGTSVAAPIAASTAALILEFTRQKALKGQSKVKNANLLETHPVEAMRKILKEHDIALQEIQDILVEDPGTTKRLTSDNRLAKNFDFVLGACHLAFSVLNESVSKLVDVAQNEYGQMHTKDKLKTMWNNQEMEDLRNNIQGQAMAVNLLLTTLQAKTSKKILKNVADNASLISLRQRSDAEEKDQRNETATINSDITDAEFNFDHEIINTPAYRRAFASARRLAIAADQSPANPPVSDVVGSSKKEEPVKLNSEQVISQSVTASDEQRVSSGVSGVHNLPEIGGSSAEDPETRASPAVAENFEKTIPTTFLDPHKRSASDSIAPTNGDCSDTRLDTNVPTTLPADTPETAVTSSQGPQSSPDLLTSKEIMRRREERLRRRHADTTERKNMVVEPQESKNAKEEGQAEVEPAPLNQQMARQIDDLSAAGANLFHAVVALQRLRASSERKFQRWFVETKSAHERSVEVRSDLEKRLREEREKRATAELASSEATRCVQEMRREYLLARDEAGRAWAELGRREQLERDRMMIQKGQIVPKEVRGGELEEVMDEEASLHSQLFSQLPTIVEDAEEILVPPSKSVS
ncbi:MAG: hypothetical protein Q9227_005013 [Pyrenula ochraceoflavens]